MVRKESKRSASLRGMLEDRGFTGVRVVWEPIQSPMEMCGHGGGWLAETDQRVEPLGLSFAEAVQHIESATWLNGTNTGDRSDG